MARSPRGRIEILRGQILAHGANFNQVQVRLEDGRELIAALPKRRKYGCLFGPLEGWRVKVVLRPPPKLPRVTEFTRPTGPLRRD